MAPPASKKSVGDYYDKLLLIVGLVLMVVMLGFAALQLMNPPKTADTTAATKKKPAPFDPAPYAEQQVPPIDSTNTNLVLVSRERVGCVNPACGKPILAKEHKDCPYCGDAQPNDDKRDTDKDTMLDIHERLAGLDPNDKADSILDKDGDLIVNWHEYRAGAKEGNPLKYDMNDPASHPPYADFLRGFRFINNPQQFYFAGVQKLGAGNFNFQVQVRNRDRTYFKKMGDMVDKTGFRIIKYEGPNGVFTPNSSKPQTPPPIQPGQPRPPEFLTIQEEGADGPVGEPIVLKKGVVLEESNRTASVIFMLDPKIRILGADKKGVKEKDSFTIMGEEYKVLKVERNRLIVQNVKDGTKWPVNPVTTEDKVKLEQVMKGTWKEAMPGEETGLAFEGQDDRDL